MFNSILVPLDGSELSYKPLGTAMKLAATGKGKLIVFSVAQPRMFNSSDPDALKDAGAAEAINVETARQHIRKAIDFAGDTAVPWEGVISVSARPCDAILEAAERYGCDLIVMATRRKMDVISTLFNESTTQEVLRKTSVPVLVFPND